MHGRIYFIAFAALTLVGCSPNSLLKPDCHSCTVEEQSWGDFSWNALSGRWQGSLETLRSEKGSKKNRVEKRVELRFLPAKEFLAAQNASTCQSLPEEAVVLNGQLWDDKSKRSEYDTFVPVDGDKVAYGRLSFEKMNGQRICQFRRFGRVMGKNRLSLPAVSFSEFASAPGRFVASADENDLSVEFLRFAPSSVKALSFAKNGRKPASAEESEKPPLMIRVFKVSSRNGGARGEWKGSEEQLYRLWKAD